MSLIGLELNDTGILAAAGNPAELICLDGRAQESPGFALPQKKELLVGRAAESRAHFYPRQIFNRFWDQLNTEPLEQSGRHTPQNNAEIAYHHLSAIWQQLQKFGNELVILTPGFYERPQLGLILGMAQELGMPVKGFLPLALAAATRPVPEKMLLHLDIHLHRLEVVYLEQGAQLILRDTSTTSEKGLLNLYREWVDAIAREFVRTTRFDPYHQAASEQELYDRLPGIISHLRHNASIVLELNGGAAPYSITLERDLMVRRAESVYGEILRLIDRMQSKRAGGHKSSVLQVSHRLARLPGCMEMLHTLQDAQIIELDQADGVLGVLGIWHRLAAQSKNQGILFFTSRPWQRPPRLDDQTPAAGKAAHPRPTHLLYRSVAYPITDKPITIGSAHDSEQNGLTIIVEAAGVSPKHCTVVLHDGETVLSNVSAKDTFVDEKRVNGSITLKLGQTIRVGSPGEQLQLIACLGAQGVLSDNML
jgi:hypothetical protein